TNWGYTNGESHWNQHFPYCAGPLQSPIAFKTAKLIFDASLRPIVLENYDLTDLAEYNFGSFSSKFAFDILPSTMTISGLPQRYTAAQLHIHWGSKTSPLGSEHTVDSKRYAAELHIVHYNSEKYPNVSMAFDKSDGLAVLGVFIEHLTLSYRLGPSVQAMTTFFHISLKSPRNVTNSHNIPAFDIRTLMPQRLDEYFRYDGSLTTPPCYQSVQWTVFKNPITVSQAQVTYLPFSIAVPLINNFRKPLPIENRVVLSSFKLGKIAFHERRMAVNAISYQLQCY
uniref:Carbonic anhydrase n=1 Tax=Hippocampus comes TaxID=109280 RepID=A0A3Q2Y0L0_HIPCM